MRALIPGKLYRGTVVTVTQRKIRVMRLTMSSTGLLKIFTRTMIQKSSVSKPVTFRKRVVQKVKTEVKSEVTPERDPLSLK